MKHPFFHSSVHFTWAVGFFLTFSGYISSRENHFETLSAVHQINVRFWCQSLRPCSILQKSPFAPSLNSHILNRNPNKPNCNAAPVFFFQYMHDSHCFKAGYTPTFLCVTVSFNTEKLIVEWFSQLWKI